jgi:hypothetical protein
MFAGFADATTEGPDGLEVTIIFFGYLAGV